jgi:hypothetical protein
MKQRSIGFWVQRLGSVIATVGALITLRGVLLPWATFPFFGLQVTLPGALLGGGWTLLIGLLALQFARRFPYFGVLLGIAAMALGIQARRDAPKLISRETLQLRQRLTPINTRLEALHLAPIEPFGTAIARTEAFLGPGPLWVITGGALLFLGSLAIPIGARLRRGCACCGSLWPESRLGQIAFCPDCGTKSAETTLCAQCGTVYGPGDKFCIRCGNGV